MNQGVQAAPTLSSVMLLLVALAAAAGTLLVLPVVFVLRYFTSWPVVAIVAAFIVLVALPFLSAWRARPF